MEWIEWLLSREFRAFIFDHNLFFPLLFLVRLVGFTTAELIRPARRVIYRSVVLNDFTAFLVYQYVVYPLAGAIDWYIAIRPEFPEAVFAMPLAVRVCCYFAVADLGHYWIHRLMHTKPMWRIHKWHHAPTYMYWFAGVRATVPDHALVVLPYAFAGSFLGLAPWWIDLAIGVAHAVKNDWMHMNVTWRSNWLEWFVVTPRYHHIHHSDKPEHYMANLAVFFTIWDRLFGTYVDPDTVTQPLSFGIGEQVPLARLVAGV